YRKLSGVRDVVGIVRTQMYRFVFDQVHRAICSAERRVSAVSISTKADPSSPSGLSRWSAMGWFPLASSVSRAAAAFSAASSSSRPVTSTMRRSKSCSWTQLPRLMPEGTTRELSPTALRGDDHSSCAPTTPTPSGFFYYAPLDLDFTRYNTRRHGL